MIFPHPRRHGWFRVDSSLAPQVQGKPGVETDPRAADNVATLVHRTHLPLIDHPDTLKHLRGQASKEGSGAWQLRDKILESVGLKLRTTQHQAIDFLCDREGALLCDDMRLGKTYSALCTHKFSGAVDNHQSKLVVIAPLSTRAMWLGNIAKIFPDKSVACMLGKTFDPSALEADIIFGHYDVLVGWQAAISIDTLVLDEFHFLTNRNARRTLAASVIRLRAQRVIGMTGSPIWNMPPDFWSLLNLVEPGAWGNYYDFSNRYGAPYQTGYGTKYTGISNENELSARLSEIMLRRRWVDVAQDLPPISRRVVVAEVTQAARNKLDILAAKLKSERSNTAGTLATYRHQLCSIKLATVANEAKKIMSRGEPVVIWTWHKKFAEDIAAALPGSQMIHGDILPLEREDLIGLWKTSTEPTALITTMAVAQVGIDLSHAMFEIFAEIDYTPSILGQAEMRPYSPLRPLDVIFVVADHIVDQRIVRALISKLGAASQVGVGAATEAIDALRDAVMGPQDSGDLDRLLEDLITSEG